MKLNRLHNLIFLLAVLAWSLTIGGFFAWDMRVARGHAEALAIKEARSNFNKDLAFRLWATGHGGVYVPRNKRTPPNPGLAHLPERDITTPSGVSLTLMNPAYMLRQLMEEYGDFYGIRGRIVSAKPLNPSNAPDPWESRALRRFEQGAEEVMEFQLAGEQSVLRLMRPMYTERGCLKCHAVQGYKVDDLRGGIGVTVPMAPYLATLKETRRNRMLFFGAIWVFGVIAIFLLDRQLLQRLRAQELHESELREKSLALERANADLTRLAEVSAHHLMEPSRRLVTYSKILQHELAEHPKEEVGTALGFIQDNACYLRNLVRDIRHYLSAGEARVPPATHDPGEAASQVWKRLNTLVAQSGGEIEIGELPPAFCDQPRLRELLTVLLENALVHAGAGKPPRIKFSGENEGEWNRYRLTDNGPGMPGVYRKRVLEIFERLSTVGKEQSKGTGIGLAIARRIVESMGGEIALEPGESGGLSVVFTLPSG